MHISGIEIIEGFVLPMHPDAHVADVDQEEAQLVTAGLLVARFEPEMKISYSSNSIPADTVREVTLRELFRGDAVQSQEGFDELVGDGVMVVGPYLKALGNYGIGLALYRVPQTPEQKVS